MTIPVVLCFGQRAAGDDAVGLWVCEQLVRDGVPARAVVDATLVIELLGQGERLIVVDAVVTASPTQQPVLHLQPAAFAKAQVSPVSSHGLGIIEAWALAETLYGAQASCIDIVAIPIERPSLEIEQLSARAQSAILPACQLVHRLIHALSGGRRVSTPERIVL